MKYLDDIYKRSDIAWFTPVELFKVLSLSLTFCLSLLYILELVCFLAVQQYCCKVVDFFFFLMNCKVVEKYTGNTKMVMV